MRGKVEFLLLLVSTTFFTVVQSQDIAVPTTPLPIGTETLLSNPPVEGEPIFLKINGLYVLYLGPVPPFISEDNVVYVPFKAMAFLLNAREAFANTAIKEAYMRRPSGAFFLKDNEASGGEFDNTFGTSFTSRYPTFDLTNHVFWLDEYEDVLVPAATLTTILGIDASWDPGTRIFEIRDPYALGTPSLLSARIGCCPVDDYDTKTSAFLPQSISAEQQSGDVMVRFKVNFLRLGDTQGAVGVTIGEEGGFYGSNSGSLQCEKASCLYEFEYKSYTGQNDLNLIYIVANTFTTGSTLDTFAK